MKKNFLKVISVVLCLAVLSTSFMFVAYAEEAAENAPFRISVSMNGDATSSRGICWFTKTNVESKVEIYTADGQLVNATVDYEEVIEWDGNYCHQAVVSGLEVLPVSNCKYASINSPIPTRFLSLSIAICFDFVIKSFKLL